jgi:hypothetical protein
MKMSPAALAALLAAVFSIPAWGFQMPAFHPLAPPRPAVRPTQPASASTVKPVSGPGKPLAKLTPEARKRLAQPVQHKAPAKKTPPQPGLRGR